MTWIFGKSIETRHGSFAAGQALPAEWDTRETRRQLVEKFGEDVLVQAQAASTQSMAVTLSAILKSLEEIKAALGVKGEAKEKLMGKAHDSGRA